MCATSLAYLILLHFVSIEISREECKLYIDLISSADEDERLKAKLRGRRFQSSEEVVNATRDAVREFPANMFQQCFRQLYQRWQTCIAANGDYFEGRCGSV
jgi:hypothetical protein